MDEVEILVIGMDEPNLVIEDRLVRFIPTFHPVNPAVARNIGLRQAQGDPILFIDADCIAGPDWVGKLVDYHHCRGAKVVGGAVVFERGNLWALADNVAMFRDCLPFTESRLPIALPTLNLSIRREVFLKTGEMDETLVRSHDMDWTVRFRAMGYKLHFEPQALVRHVPLRNNFSSVMRHWVATGQDMSEVLVRYKDLLKPPFVVEHRWLMLGFAPIIAAFLSGRMFWSAPKHMAKYLDTLPLIYLTQLAWCWGMFRGLPK